MKDCCGRPAQCWEPCGDLGKNENYVKVSETLSGSFGVKPKIVDKCVACGHNDLTLSYIKKDRILARSEIEEFDGWEQFFTLHYYTKDSNLCMSVIGVLRTSCLKCGYKWMQKPLNEV